jgi:hypothetical protein
MLFDHRCEQTLELTFLDRAVWQGLCHDARLPWTAGPTGLRWDQLVNDNGFRRIDEVVEPGDVAEKTWLVPIPPGDWVAYQASLVIRSCAKKVITTGRPFAGRSLTWRWSRNGRPSESRYSRGRTVLRMCCPGVRD